MDPVRFGRALGAGARAAAKTVVQAADAAATPNPRQSAATTEVLRPVARGAADRISPKVAAASSARAKPMQAPAAKAGTTARGVREGARRFGREVWGPAVRLSGVLGLEFAGVFFGIFALFALGAAWKLRGAWHTTVVNGPEHHRLLGALAMLVLFGYFCVSSFVRATRRGRAR